MDLRNVTAAPDTSATLVEMTLDPGVAGREFLLIVSSNPSAQLTLVVPDGSELGPVNNQGYVFTAVTALTLKDLDVPPPLGIGGTQTLIELPSLSAAGMYRVRVNTTGIMTPTKITVMYISASPVRLGVAPHAYSYRVGDRVILSAFLFHDNQPLAGANVNGTLYVPADVTTQVSAGSFSEVRRTELGNGSVDYELSAILTNSGGPLMGVLASVQVVDASLTVRGADEMFIGDMASGAGVPIPSTFVLRVPEGETFSPALLKWKVVASGSQSPLVFADSGPNDAAAGDGTYTGVYTATNAGRQRVIVRASGSTGGRSFSRSALVEFEVIDAVATIQAYQDGPRDENANGRAEGITVGVTVTTSQPGGYTLQGEILDAQGNQLGQSSEHQDLTAGTSSIALDFYASGTWPDNQPLKLANFVLLKDEGEDETIVAASADLGLTRAYVFEKAALALSGQNSSELLDLNGLAGAEILRVNVGISPALATESVSCSWSGYLLPAAPATSPSLPVSGTFFSKTPVSSIPFEIDTFAIRQAGLVSPYRLVNISISCLGQDDLNRRLELEVHGDVFTTPAYASTLLELGMADFTLRVDPPFLTIRPGSQTYLFAPVSSQAGFAGPVTLSADGLPSGIAATPTGLNMLSLDAASTTTAGVYPVLVTGTSGTLTHVSSGLLNVSDLPASGYRISTWPAGLQFLADTIAYTAPATLAWPPGPGHDLSVATSQSLNGLVWEFAGWADGGSATRAIFPGSEPGALVAYFRADITNSVGTTRIPLVQNRRTGTLAGGLTVTNTSTQTLTGPIRVVLTGLTSGVTLLTATGTYQGSPYMDLPVTVLAPGATATVGFRFKDSSNAAIDYTPRVLLGVL
ncbi:hypothetical protein [uncultured Paludibaculum sp.]|uniref:hypothetical protein n=1 Tax=uncultured Paludibaculum sp. TaxID=1765020 RepID=UPI002AAB20B6|nr:hypothetical protein [uncultured Paludibaculum sp.]